MTTAPQPRARKWQFSLRAILCAVSLCGALCGWFAWKLVVARTQQSAVARLRQAYPSVQIHYDSEPIGPDGWTHFALPTPPAVQPDWFERTLGKDFFSQVIEIDVSDSGTFISPQPIIQLDPELIAPFSRLERLSLLGISNGDPLLEAISNPGQVERIRLYSDVTGRTVRLLNRFSALRSLDILSRNLPPGCLEGLAGNAKLEELCLPSCPIANQDANCLRQFHVLRRLDLSDTAINDEFFFRLAELPELRELQLSAIPNIGDTELSRLAGFKKLRMLGLDGKYVTDASLKCLIEISGLEELELGTTRLTDLGLESLQRLRSLKSLSFYSERTTDEGLKKLRQALPHTVITFGFPM